METTTHKQAEPIIESWPLMASPAPLLLIISSYLLFVLKVGPKYMQNRKPLNLTNFTRFYNVYQLLICSSFIHHGYLNGFSMNQMWKCVQNESDLDNWLQYKNGQWWFLMLRLSELLETFVFVLRKKQKQVSILHVYHHISTAVIVWTYVKYNPCKLMTVSCCLVFLNNLFCSSLYGLSTSHHQHERSHCYVHLLLRVFIQSAQLYYEEGETDHNNHSTGTVGDHCRSHNCRCSTKLQRVKSFLSSTVQYFDSDCVLLQLLCPVLR